MMLVLKRSLAREAIESRRARPAPGSFLVGVCPTSPAHKARGLQLRTYDLNLHFPLFLAGKCPVPPIAG